VVDAPEVPPEANFCEPTMTVEGTAEPGVRESVSGCTPLGNDTSHGRSCRPRPPIAPAR
jgi:hypothetical protein